MSADSTFRRTVGGRSADGASGAADTRRTPRSAAAVPPWELAQGSTARLSLLAVLQRTAAREVAARCRVSPSRVSEWASGRSRPTVGARAVLEQSYGIAAAGWEQLAPKGRQ